MNFLFMNYYCLGSSDLYGDVKDAKKLDSGDS